MRLWVTGSSGFLGRHVVQEALRRGHELLRLDVDLVEDDFTRLVPKLDAVIHCAAVTRWSPKPRSDSRFAKNIELLRRVAEVAGARAKRLIVPLPHGALAPWNAYSQSMREAVEQFGALNPVPPVRVYLPTLYGLGDPHHAKAIPSFLLAATGRGEQPIALYPPPDTGIYRHYMHVETAARILVDCAEGQELDEIITGPDRWEVRYLTNLVQNIAAKYGRNLIIEERGWQYKPDGAGAPVPACIGPDGGPMTGPLPAWLDKVIGDALKNYKKQDPPPSPAVPKPLDVLSDPAKDYMIVALRLKVEPDNDRLLDELDGLWWAMPEKERAAVEKLIAESGAGRVASADAPPPPVAPPVE